MKNITHVISYQPSMSRFAAAALCAVLTTVVVGQSGHVESSVTENFARRNAYQAEVQDPTSLADGWIKFVGPAFGKAPKTPPKLINSGGGGSGGGGTNPVYGLAPSSWPKYQADVANSGRATANGIASPTTHWSFTAGATIETQAVTGVDNTIYFGCDDGKLYAVSQAGKLLWSFATGGAILSTPAVGANGIVYFGSADGNVYAVTLSTGLLAWKYTTGGAVNGAPNIDPNGTVYIGSSDQNVYALAETNGQLVWKSNLGADINTCPALGNNGQLYVYAGQTLQVLSTTTGELVWSYVSGESNQFLVGSPAIDSANSVYISHDRDYYYGFVSVFSAAGTETWYKGYEVHVKSGPALGANGVLYVGWDDGQPYLVEMNIATGALLATIPTLDYARTVNVAGDGTCYGSGPLFFFSCKGAAVSSTQGQHGPTSIGADSTIYTSSGKLLLALGG